MNANTISCSECSCHLIESCAAGYHPLVGNGFCNDDTNIAECDYDGGDCCGYIINSEHCTECTCFYQETCLAGVTHVFVGDGFCNDETNIADCDYDGEDCCLIIRISLTNELLNAGYEYVNGDYEISIMPNGHTSWINGGYAIWYNSGYWLIGHLADIGELTGFMYAINNFHGITDDENEWHYGYGSSWISPTDQSDIQITCVNE